MTDQLQLPPSIPNIAYVFPSAYGGAVQSSEPPQIHALMRELRRAITLEAKKAAGGPMFPVKSAKELNQKLAEALDALNMTAPVVAQEITLMNPQDIPDNKNKNGTQPVFRTLCHVKATVRLTAPDTSFVDMVGSGHGGDVDDKSGGKASTFAWKDAILKGCTIPHEDMVDTDDESTTSPNLRSVPSTSKANPKGSENAYKAAPPTAVVGDAKSSEENSGIAWVTALINNAADVAELEGIRERIKSGALSLHGQDKLTASTIFGARMKVLRAQEEPENGPSAS